MSKVDAFIKEAVRVANDPKSGYSQLRRWGPDFDCASLMYHCADVAGFKINQVDPRYTGTMIRDFTNVGYRCDVFDGVLTDLEPGDILLNVTHHTGVYIGSGKMVQASQDEVGGITGPKSGDQTGAEIHVCAVYNYPWTHVLTPPKESSSQPTSEPQYKTVSKDVLDVPLESAISRIALECINGRYGNGTARKENLYAVVQARVEQMLKG